MPAARASSRSTLEGAGRRLRVQHTSKLLPTRYHKRLRSVDSPMERTQEQGLILSAQELGRGRSVRHQDHTGPSGLYENLLVEDTTEAQNNRGVPVASHRCLCYQCPGTELCGLGPSGMVAAAGGCPGLISREQPCLSPRMSPPEGLSVPPTRPHPAKSWEAGSGDRALPPDQLLG